MRRVAKLGAMLLLIGSLFASTVRAEDASLNDALAAGQAALDHTTPAATPSTTPDGSATPAVTNSGILPAAPNELGMRDPVTRGKYLRALGRYYDYRNDGYAFRSEVFAWQLLSSRIIFVIVLLLVLLGIYFAAVQFHVALAAARAPLPPVKKPDAALDTVEAATDTPHQATGETRAISALNTQLEISAKGIVVNSSVLGVVILALSLAFFYLYLVYVYPITDAL